MIVNLWHIMYYVHRSEVWGQVVYLCELQIGVRNCLCLQKLILIIVRMLDLILVLSLISLGNVLAY